MKKTGRKWSTKKCGRCEEPHLNYSGKLDAEGIEYVVCGITHKRMNVPNGHRYGLAILGKIKHIMYATIWEDTSDGH